MSRPTLSNELEKKPNLPEICEHAIAFARKGVEYLPSDKKAIIKIENPSHEFYLAVLTALRLQLEEAVPGTAMIKSKPNSEKTPSLLNVLPFMLTNFFKLNEIYSANCVTAANCQELTLLALFDVTKEYPEVLAEAYCVDGGDHVFLAINRDPNSNINDPSTWGKNAYICDPFQGEYFNAMEYKSKLAVYEEVRNPILDHYVVRSQIQFDDKKHKINPLNNSLTSKNINDIKNIQLIENAYYSKLRLMHKTMETLKNRLKKYPENDRTTVGIKKQIDELQHKIQNELQNPERKKQGAEYIASLEIRFNKEFLKNYDQLVETLKKINPAQDAKNTTSFFWSKKPNKQLDEIITTAENFRRVF